MRFDIVNLLRDNGYKVTIESDKKDPFAWAITAEKDDYVIRVSEQSRDLCNTA